MELRSRLGAKASFEWEAAVRDWQPTHLRAAVRKATARFAGEGRPPPPQLRIEQALAEVTHAWSERQALHGVSPRALRLVPFFLFRPAGASAPDGSLAADADFRDAYLRWIADKNRSTTLAVLLKAFLAAYPTEAPHFEGWRQALVQSLSSSHGIAAERWWARCSRFELLEVDGPKRYSRIVFPLTEDPVQLFAQAGLDGELASSRFMEASQRWAMALLAKEVSSQQRLPIIDRFLSLLRLRPDRLRFDSLRPGVASALLKPFDLQDPPPELKNRIQQVLLDLLGDPRVAPAPWHGVPDPERRTMLRWLTAVAFETFMQILDMTAAEQWQARREFWEGYLPKDGRPGALVEAWPVFGARAAALARDRLNLDRELFGDVRTDVNNQSVLIMRIVGPSGSLTACEWSHSGALRFWVGQYSDPPQFYKKHYAIHELRGKPDESFPHHAGVWQQRVSAWIQKQTGARRR